ncbi:hypothetical protein HKX48_006544 [Thoreauomyces humboldtii]|nr:hypothetical protein HKX48_006544 [Thoreauomyces humboldtii]
MRKVTTSGVATGRGGGGRGGRGGGHKDVHGHGHHEGNFQHGRGKKFSGYGSQHLQQAQPAAPPVALILSRAAASVKETVSGEIDMHTRALFIMASLIGTEVLVEVGDGSIYKGIFVAGVPDRQDLSVALSCARRQNNGKPGPLIKEIILYGKDVNRISSYQTTFESTVKSSAGEREVNTDTAISGHAGNVRERPLQKWAPDASTTPAMGLEDGPATIGKWDQFATNEAKFGVTSDFDEHLYTTSVNKADPGFKKREAEAIRLAREIERGPTNNAHMAEERNLAVQGTDGMDEEDRYSSVIRQPGKYVPPGARKASVTGFESDTRHQDAKPVTSAAKDTSAAKGTLAAKATPAAKEPPAAKPTPATSAMPVAPASVAASAPVEQPKAAPLPALEKSKVSTSASLEQPKVAASVAVEHPKAAPLKKAGNLTPAVIAKLAQKTSMGNASDAVPSAPVDPKEVADAFKDYARSEKEKMGKKRSELEKQEKLNMVQDFKDFSKSFKLRTPMPEDLQNLLNKSEPSRHAVQKSNGGVEPSAAAPIEASRKETSLEVATKTENSSDGSKSKKDVKGAKVGTPLPVKDAVVVKDKNSAPVVKEKKAFKPNPAAAVFKPNPAAAEFIPSFAMAKSPPTVEKSPYNNKRGGKGVPQYGNRQQYGKGNYRSNVPFFPYAPHYANEEMYQAGVGPDAPYFAYPQMAPYGYRPMGRPFIPNMNMPPGGPYMPGPQGQYGPGGFVPHGQVFQYGPVPAANMRMFPKGQPYPQEENGGPYQPGVSSPMQPFMRSPPPQMYQAGPMMGGPYHPEMMGPYGQPMMMGGPPHGWVAEAPMPHGAPVVPAEPEPHQAAAPSEAEDAEE